VLAAIPVAWKIAGVAILLLVLSAAGAGLYAKGRSDGRLAIEAADAKAVADAQKKADDLANELIIAQAQAMAVTEKTVVQYRDRIVNAPKTSSCGPAVRDAAAGVRDILRGGEADPAGSTGAAVHRP
jgi:hypothetical protein